MSVQVGRSGSQRCQSRPPGGVTNPGRSSWGGKAKEAGKDEFQSELVFRMRTVPTMNALSICPQK